MAAKDSPKYDSAAAKPPPVEEVRLNDVKHVPITHSDELLCHYKVGDLGLLRV
jgi:hypothetical protein